MINPNLLIKVTKTVAPVVATSVIRKFGVEAYRYIYFDQPSRKACSNIKSLLKSGINEHDKLNRRVLYLLTLLDYSELATLLNESGIQQKREVTLRRNSYANIVCIVEALVKVGGKPAANLFLHTYAYPKSLKKLAHKLDKNFKLGVIHQYR